MAGGLPGNMSYPTSIQSHVAGLALRSGSRFAKINPATGSELAIIERPRIDDIGKCIQSAEQSSWPIVPIAERARIVLKAVETLRANKSNIAELLALESGRSVSHARKEIDAAAACGQYLAEHARAILDEPLESFVPGRTLTLRHEPLGVGVLITPFNNPLAGIAWKLFPALLSGNTAIIKAHELSPLMPHLIARELFDAGVDEHAITIVEGGVEHARALVKDSSIEFVSFTGSPQAGSSIVADTADRLLRVSIESGGKNPLVVCDDADIDRAASAAVASAFIDAGQRCTAASRIIVFSKIYESFRESFLIKVAALKVGIEDGDDYGAIISEERLMGILSAIENATREDATLLHGGKRINRPGYFIEPTVFENAPLSSDLSQKEIFGPVVALYRARDIDEAISMANSTPYRLSSAIHTRDALRAQLFARRYRGGVVRINGPTFGSEPHVPFGGEGLSGNGWREPGLAAFDFYTSLKQVSSDT